MDKYLNPEFLITAAVVIFGGAIYYYFKKKKENGDNTNIFKGSILRQYSDNFTQQIKDGKMDPVIGRKAEVQELIEVLARRTKNNALLLGEPGVGKTAVAERLAQRIVKGEVPDSLKGKEVLALDLTSLVSGTKYRGELEKRLEALSHEFESLEKSIILFIDEIQELAQAKGAEGGLSPGDILKPELARGNLQLIGATTYDDYEKYIKPEKSLDRRFHPIYIHEPTDEEVLEILLGVKNVYEEYHKVRYPEPVLKTIVKLSKKYIEKRFLPDKAIDILDEAGVHVRLQASQKKTCDTTEIIEITEDDIRRAISQWIDKLFEEII